MNARQAQRGSRLASVALGAALLIAGCKFDTLPLEEKARAERMCPHGSKCPQNAMGPAMSASPATAGASAPPPAAAPVAMRCLDRPTQQASSCDEVCCGAADSCCPRGCDAQSDPDCSTQCGDGVVESPETCEPSNRAAICPKSCDDGDRCTTDLLLGSPDNCNVRCSNTPISVPADGDGCCPPGATAANDLDCPATSNCGNGQVEADEECDGSDNCTLDCHQRFDPSLVHRYSFEGTGDIAVDSVGGKNGRVIGAALDGNDLRLDGARGHVALPPNMLHKLGNATIEAWITWRGGSAGQRLFEFSNRGVDPERNEGRAFFTLSPMNGRNQLEVQFNFTPEFDPVNTFYLRSDPLTPNVEQHVAITFDGVTQTARLYLNGELTGEPLALPGTLTQIDDKNAWLGLSQFSDDPGMSGVIHEFRIYSAALDAVQVKHSFVLGPDVF